MDRQRFLTRVLRLDAVSCVFGGVAVAITSGDLATAVGVHRGWLGSLGGVLVVYGLCNWMTARASTPRRAVQGLVVADLAFAAAMVGLALTNPWGGDTWVRWLMATVGDASVVIGMVKWYGLRGDATAVSAADVRAPAPAAG